MPIFTSSHTCIKSLKLYIVRMESDLSEADSTYSELLTILS